MSSVDADRNRLAYRINVERAGLARLEAEQARARKLVFPSELQAAAAQDERVQTSAAERDRRCLNRGAARSTAKWR